MYQRLLQRVRTLRLEVRGASQQVRGTGAVAVEHPDANVIVWHEHGRWMAGAGPLGRFRNVYRWTFAPDGLQVAHLRRGPGRPTPLLTLRPVGRRGRLEMVAPHHCGQDRYAARLHVQRERVVLSWRITGPSKDLRMQGIYHPADQHTAADGFM